MKRILTLAAALAVTVGFAMPANAQSQIIILSGQNPSSTEANQESRFIRLALGTWIKYALGNQLGSGLFGGLSVVPNGGMNIAVQNSVTNAPGAIIQSCPDDTNPVPSTGTPFLSADATTIGCLGLVSTSSGSIGPMTAPGTGLSQYYLLESQLVRVDTNPQTVTFENSSGVKTTSSQNRWRVDQPNYQLKAGTASSTPTVPTADSGWMGIATVLVPSGTATITSGMISMLPSFSGFIANGANVSVTGLTISSLTAGCLQTNSSGVVSSLTCTSGLGSVGATAPITASTVSGTATVGCPTCVTAVNGGTGITSSGGSTPSMGLSHGDYIDQGSAAQTRAGALTTGAFTSTGNIAGGSTSGTTFSLGPQMQAQSNGSTSTNNSYNVGFKSSNSGTINLYANGLTNAQTHSFLANGGATFTGPFTLTPFTTAGVVTNNASGVFSTTTAPTMSGANITSGTIGQTQVANGYADLASTQTIGGPKTFSNNVTGNGTLTVAGGSFLNGGLSVSGGSGIALTGSMSSSGGYTTGGSSLTSSALTVGGTGTDNLGGVGWMASNGPACPTSSGNQTAGVYVAWNCNAGHGEGDILIPYTYGIPGSYRLLSFYSGATEESRINRDGTYQTGSSLYGPSGATMASATIGANPGNTQTTATTTTNYGRTSFITRDGGTAATEYGSINFGNPAVAAGSIDWQESAGPGAFAFRRNDSGAYVPISVGAVNSNARVGSQDLTVNSNAPISAQGAYLQWNRAYGATFLVNQKGLGTGGISFGHSDASNNYTQDAFLDESGNLTATTFNVSSRREWKKNISTLSPQDALKIALDTPIVRYNYNGKGGHPNESGPYRHTGIIANGASDVITTHNAKGERVGEDIGAMGAVAFAAIQRQQQMLDALAYDNKVLRSRIAGLELHAAVERVVNPGWHRVIAKHPTCPKGTVPKRNKNGRIVGCISHYETPPCPSGSAPMDALNPHSPCIYTGPVWTH